MNKLLSILFVLLLVGCATAPKPNVVSMAPLVKQAANSRTETMEIPIRKASLPLVCSTEAVLVNPTLSNGTFSCLLPIPFNGQQQLLWWRTQDLKTWTLLTGQLLDGDAFDFAIFADCTPDAVHDCYKVQVVQ